MARLRWIMVATLVLAVGACNDDGRTLAPAPTVPVSPETTAATPDADPAPFAVSTPTVDDQGMLDPAFTCDGIDVHPEILISGVPIGAIELGLSVVDLDANDYVHWVVAGLDATTTRLESGVLPPTAVTAQTTGGVNGWQGPCPPQGEPAHRYELTVYAMAEPVGLAPDLDGPTAITILEDASTATASTELRYSRPAEG